jgi:hypothetical protein
MVSERKTVEMKQRAEAIATQRQEIMIPLKQHRRFSETVAIDHRARPQELQVRCTTSLLLVNSLGMLLWCGRPYDLAYIQFCGVRDTIIQV